jgi:hypothetical protein
MHAWHGVVEDDGIDGMAEKSSRPERPSAAVSTW